MSEKKSTCRGFLFYGFFCGPEIPWKPSEKDWEEIYRDKVGWPQKPNIMTIVSGEDRLESLNNWAAEDFRMFYLMGIQIDYLEPAGEWVINSRAFLGPDLLPHKLEQDVFILNDEDEKIKKFCETMGLEYKTPSWHLTAIPFSKEEK